MQRSLAHELSVTDSVAGDQALGQDFSLLLLSAWLAAKSDLPAGHFK